MSALKPWTLIIGFYILILSILSFDWFLPEKSGYSASFFSIYLFCILLFLSIMTVAPLMLYRLSGLIYLWLTGLLFILFSWVTFLKDVFSIEIFDLLSYFLFCYFLLFMLLSISFRIPKITFPEFIKHKHHIFENWTVALGFLNLINFNILNNSNPDNSVNPMNTLTYSFFIFLIFPILYANIYTLYYNNYKKIQKFLLSGLLILGFLFFIAVWNTPESNNLINLFFSLLILLGSSFLALSFKSESLFKLAIIAFILRLYFFYIEIFQNLIQTGISLILIGLVIIILFIVHQKYKEKLEQWMRQLE